MVSAASCSVGNGRGGATRKVHRFRTTARLDFGAEGFSLFSLLAKSIPIDEACFSFLSLQEPSEATSSTAAKDGSRMMELERRIAQLELNREYKSDKRAVMELEVDMLAKLRTIREEVAKGGAGGGTSLKEADALKVEVERLRSENEKHHYRIEHLVDSIKELQAKLNKGKHVEG